MVEVRRNRFFSTFFILSRFFRILCPSLPLVKKGDEGEYGTPSITPTRARESPHVRSHDDVLSIGRAARHNAIFCAWKGEKEKAFFFLLFALSQKAPSSYPFFSSS